MTELHQIHECVQRRVDEITSKHTHWPCRKGCDDCCRGLASAPRISFEEWQAVAAAVNRMPEGIAADVRKRIQESAGASRPVICPLLDRASGTCMVYEARPVACRAYGFYAERSDVLGCARVELISVEAPDVVWGNHEALENKLRLLGPSAELSEWLLLSDVRAEL